ncbi:MAG: V4R domain-containing protein, partial [Mycobacterium leprae]
VAVTAFQLFRLMGFESLAEALGASGEERDEMEYVAGMAMGRALVRKGSLPRGDLQQVIDAFGRFYEQLGLGLTYFHRHADGSVALGIHECAGCDGTPLVHRPVCYVEAGLVAGVFSEALGVDYKAHEVKCIGGLGDDACEFVLTEK